MDVSVARQHLSPARAQSREHCGIADIAGMHRIVAARDFFEFDAAVTAPMHGFRSCYDYGEKSSSRQFLQGIRVPTLIVNARNDFDYPLPPAQMTALMESYA